jgi:hypothetical protein
MMTAASLCVQYTTIPFGALASSVPRQYFRCYGRIISSEKPEKHQ